MTKAIVDRFKIVDIQHHNADPFPFLAYQPRTTLHKGTTGQYVGKRIIVRDVLKPAQQRITGEIHAGDSDGAQGQ